MKCPYCGSDRHNVCGSGNKQEDHMLLGYKRRRRICKDCGRKFWTVEEYVASRSQR